MLTAAIQAGGASSRMGRNKACLPFLGVPLIERVVQRIEPMADQLLIITNEPELFPFLNHPLIPDLLPGHGALGGLFTALASVTTPFIANIACDMPFVNPDLLAHLYEFMLENPRIDIAVPKTERGFEPMHAVYRRETCLPAVRESLHQGQRRMIAWFDQVHVQPIEGQTINSFDPDQLAFINLNTPEDFLWAETLATNASGDLP